MKLRLFTCLLATGGLFAQSNSTTYNFDINGNLIPQTGASSASSNGNDDHTVYSRGASGNTVPLEKTESRVISEGPNGKVVETTVQHYGLDGQPTTKERVLTEQEKGPNGSSTVRETHSSSDINGTLREDQHTMTQSQTQGASTSTSVEISRAGADGGFQPSERRSIVTTSAPGKVDEDETVYKANGNGQFQQASRRVKSETTADGKTVSNENLYQPDLQGQMHLEAGQIKTVTKSPDGSEQTQVDILGFQPGRPRTGDSQPIVTGQQSIVRKAGANGTVVETTSYREASPDNGKLGNARVIAETVCSGKCDTPPPASAPPAPAAKPVGP